MSATQRELLWERLCDGGLVEGELPAAGDARAPWFVRMMLGIAGWIGALFLLGFVGAAFAFVMKSPEAMWLVGAGTCFAAVTIFRAVPKNDFIAQFGLAVSLAGQALLVFGAAHWFERSITTMALYVALQQVLLFVLVPNYVHRLWAAWSATSAATYAMVDVGLYTLTPAATSAVFLWAALNEMRLARQGPLVRPGAYGLALSAVQASVLHGSLMTAFVLGSGRHWLSLGDAGPWVGRIASFGVLLGAVIALLRREGISLNSGQGRTGIAGALILGLVSIKAPGVGPAAAVLIVGYANGDRVLAGLGVFALLGYLSHFYYSLQTTLLEKSALLVAAGVALLLARLALRIWWPDPGKKEASHA